MKFSVFIVYISINNIPNFLKYQVQLGITKMTNMKNLLDFKHVEQKLPIFEYQLDEEKIFFIKFIYHVYIIYHN